MTKNNVSPWMIEPPMPGLDTPWLKINKMGDVTGFRHGDFVHAVLLDDFWNIDISYIDNGVYVYDPQAGYWVPGEIAIERIVRRFFCNATRRDIDETWAALLVALDVDATKRNKSNPWYISCANGAVDLRKLAAGDTDCLVPHSRDHFSLFRLEYEYNPDAYDEAVDRFLFNVADDKLEVRTVLEEVVGTTLFASNKKYRQAVILYGDGLNGKSTYLDWVEHLLGSSNVHHEDVDNLSGFLLAPLNGKLLNVDGDAKNGNISKDAMKNIKMITGGDTITANRKGRTPINYTPICKLILAANDYFSIDGGNAGTGAIESRFVFVPFSRQFSKDDADYDPDVLDHITTKSAMEYTLKLAIDGLVRVINQNWQLSSTSLGDALRDEWLTESDSIAAWLRDAGVTSERITANQDISMYDWYCNWCHSSGANAFKRPKFTRQLAKKFPGLKQIDSKFRTTSGRMERKWVYVTDDGDDIQNIIIPGAI